MFAFQCFHSNVLMSSTETIQTLLNFVYYAFNITSKLGEKILNFHVLFKTDFRRFSLKCFVRLQIGSSILFIDRNFIRHLCISKTRIMQFSACRGSPGPMTPDSSKYFQL